MRYRYRCVGVALVGCVVGWIGSGSAYAQPIAKKDIPKALAPWVPWVLHAQQQNQCPVLPPTPDESDGAMYRQCDWPSRLTLNLSETGGRFTQHWRLYARGFARLPGDAKRWPQDVRVDGKPAPVVTHNAHPVLMLDGGYHRITGTFTWDTLPEALQVPPSTALLQLSLSGKVVPFLRRDDSGRVSLQQTERVAHSEDRLDVRVHRKIADDLPLTIETQILLDVAGKHRNVVFPGAILKGFVALSLNSPLPARVEQNGGLHLELRPGSWTVTLLTRSEGRVEAITLPKHVAPWPPEEVWVFAERPQLRRTLVAGVTAIDPQQTTIPAQWKKLPTYRVTQGESLRLVEKRRGNADAPADKLTLRRNMWLDFDGKGMTFVDNVNGQLNRSWRLEMQKSVRLGRVAIDGDNQFITRGGTSGLPGVEVRTGALTLEAESRIDTDATRPPAVGWNHDFRDVSATLHLPPGWRLLDATGPDNITRTWLKQWSLLDLFMLLLVTLAAGRLFGWPAGLLALATMALCIPERGAPLAIWVVVLVIEALRRVLPDGRWARLARMSHLVAGALLVVLAVPFAAKQLRHGIYPALELSDTTPSFGCPLYDMRGGMPAEALMEQTPEFGGLQAELQEKDDQSITGSTLANAAPEGGIRKKRMRGYGRGSDLSLRKAGKLMSSSGLYAQQQQTALNLMRQDPHAVVQTGPGRPKWNWRTVNLSWSGPVKRDQRVHLTLIAPWLNLLFSILRVILLGALVFVVLRLRPRAPRKLATGAVLGALLALLPNIAHADMPSPEILEDLRTRLLTPQRCEPNCASIGRMMLEASDTALQVRLEVSAAADAVVALPGHSRHWLPRDVLLDRREAQGLLWENGRLLLEVPAGNHEVLLSGPLPPRENVQLPLPMTPHHVASRSAHWRIDGIHEDGLSDTSLQLTRIRTTAPTQSSETTTGAVLPPFVQIERVLLLGLTWEVETTVKRLSPAGSAVVLRVPLLAGESVTSADTRVENGQVLINMGLQSTVVTWRSRLAPRDTLKLIAPKRVSWVERWQLQAGPVWHVTTDGFPSVQPPSDRNREQIWRPWPGEQLTLHITRPAGIKGQTLTIDESSLTISPGARASEATLTVKLRSSRGTEHQFRLPEGATLQEVTVDGKTRLLRQQGDRVNVPVVPGSQTITLKWRSDTAMTSIYRSPRVDLGIKSVNANTTIRMPGDRWTLLVGGPRMGPAVLFWSKLIVLIVVAFFLGRMRLTPLRWLQWALLGIGLSTLSIWLGVLVAGWLLFCGWRGDTPQWSGRIRFNLRQVILVEWTFVALGVLYAAIHFGLLGQPDMQISGNLSSANTLRWFVDRSGNLLPQSWVLSVPMWSYRVLMLGWAIWIAWSMVGWSRWFWRCFTTGGGWRKKVPLSKPDAPQADSQNTTP